MPDKMRCSHILLSWDGAANSSHSRDLIYAISDAKEIISDLIRETIAWKAACKEHSACDSWFYGGDLGWFEQHEITPELWFGCSLLEIGEVSAEPIQSPYGVHILMRTG